ncbi:MAG TPA: response regulator, partial [Sphingomonas sp.]
MTAPRILVVEDDRVTAREILAALADHGLDADHVATAGQVIERVAGGRYDALVLDRMLPGEMDGLAALARMRA